MKKKSLLSLALLLAATASQAQVVMQEDFDAEQTKTSADVGYYEFINTQEFDEREVKDGALHFYNSDATEGQNWQRAVKFRNLPIKENTSYRVTVKLMGDNTYSMDGVEEVKSKARFALMQGGENLDMGFLAANGEQQFSDISHFQMPSEGKGYYTYKGLFYYSTDAVQKAWYADNNPDKEELPSTYFLTLNVYNPGDYYIDQVVVEESSVSGVYFRDDVIRVDFGYGISTAILNGQKRLVMPEGCTTVKLNGKEVGVLTAELMSDGKFYIFLADEYSENGDEDEVYVSFTNPAEPAFRLQYADGKTPGGAVLDFSDEKAIYNGDLEDVYSFAYETPTLVSADPEDGSFNLPLNTNTFTLTFDKDVNCDNIEAYLDKTRLTPSPATGLAKQVVFTRSGDDLAAGEYTLTVTKIYPEVILADDVYGEEKLSLTFGAVNADPNDTTRVVMTDGFEEAGAGAYPDKWIVMSDGNLRTSATDSWGSGSRLMGGFTGGDNTVYMYLSGRSGSEGYAFYGAKEAAEDKFHLTPGKYQMTFRCAAWDTTDKRSVKVQVTDELDGVLVEQTTEVNPGPSNSNKDVSAMEKIEVNFRIAVEGNYVLKFWGLSSGGTNGGWGDAILFGSIQVKYLPNAAGVEETNMLLTALADAKAVLDNNADERYAGIDYETLKAVIEKHDGKATVYTAPSVFRAAVAELNAAADAMKTHHTLCDTYDPLVDNAIAARDTRTGTKFERHESYAAIEAAIAKYEGRVLTDNDELTEAITELQNTTATVQNIGRVVENYLASMMTGLQTIDRLGATDDELTAEVNDLLTDDAHVKNKVKGTLRTALYIKLADPANDVFGTKIDDDTLMEYEDSLNLSVFVNNPELYYTGWDDKAPANITKVQPSSETLPGWTISNVQKGWDFGYHYPWGASSQYYYNEITCPNANGMIAAWTSGFDLDQTIENLPAGKYTLYVGIGERGGNESPTSYIFANDKQQVIPVIAGSVEPTDNVYIEDILVTDGTLKIGAHVDNTDHVFVNCFHLFMKGAAPGFDYLAGVNDINSEVGVRRTEMFDLNGRRVNSDARGLVIVKKTMADGSVKAEKVIR